MKRLVDMLLIFGAIGSGYLIGISSHTAKASIVQQLPITIVKEVPVEIIKEVPVIQTVETVKEVPVYVMRDKQLADFESRSALIEWLTSDSTNRQTWIAESFDCDDFAYQLQTSAEQAGYHLSAIPISPADYLELFKEPLQYDFHVMNLARIGNNLYLVEPQTDLVSYYGFLDVKE